VSPTAATGQVRRAIRKELEVGFPQLKPPLVHYHVAGQRMARAAEGAIGIKEAIHAHLDPIICRLCQNSREPNKLVRLKVDFGDHTSSILVGMKEERENPKAEIEGRQALFVVNLEPRKMAGEYSEGMIFDIGYADRLVPVLALPEKLVPNGARAG
jgi:tRNA-binding protein